MPEAKRYGRIARMGGALACAALVAACQRPSPPGPQPAADARTGDTVTVRQVTKPDGTTGRFVPAVVRVRRGDVLRFVTDGRAAHNVSFPPSDNPGATGLPTPMPYTVRPGQTQQIVVDLAPGTYRFQCDPHAPLGERGTLIVS